MGLVYFNSASKNGTGSVASPLFQPKPQFNLYNTYKDATGLKYETTGRAYNWRSGAGNYGWDNNGGQITLSSVNSSGVVSTVATTTLTTLLTSAQQSPAFHYSSADQCWYFLLSDGSSLLRLVKMNDTTGVFTGVGTSFTPTTFANWGGNGSTPQIAQIYIDSVTGHLKVIYNGYYHLLNKSTGAIVSQNTQITLGSFNSSSCNYFTADGVIGLTPFFDVFSTTSLARLPRLVHSTSGHLTSTVVPLSFVGDNVGRSVQGTIDGDKLIIGAYPNPSSSVNPTIIILRSDYDKLIQSIYDYYTSS